MNPTSDTNEEEGEVDRPFMTGGYSFEKRMISNAKDRKRPFMTGGPLLKKKGLFVSFNSWALLNRFSKL
jgi:hypothetical protein